MIWKCVLKLCPSIWRKEKVYNGFLIWFLKYAKYLTLGKKKSQINLFEALKNTLTHVESLFTCAFELNFVIFLFFEKSKKPFKTFVWFAYYIYIYIYISSHLFRRKGRFEQNQLYGSNLSKWKEKKPIINDFLQVSLWYLESLLSFLSLNITILFYINY